MIKQIALNDSKKKISLLFGILTIATIYFGISLKANIDTTTGPDLDKAKVMTTTYTFTNFELARGTVRFRQGFTIPAGVTATLDVHEQVSGPLTITGTLNLAGDLYLAPGATIISDGSGAGNITHNRINLNGYTIYLMDDLVINNSMNIYPTPGGVIDGTGHQIRLPDFGFGRLSFTPNTFGVFDSTATLTVKNLRFENCQTFNLRTPGGSFINPTPTATLSLDNVFFQMAVSSQFTLVSEQIHLYRNINIATPQNARFTLSTSPTGQLFIHTGAILYVGPGIGFALSSVSNPIFEDYSAIMHLNNADLLWFTPRTENALTNGTVIVEGVVKFDHRNSNSGLPFGRIKIGNDNANEDLNLLILPGSTLKVAPSITLVYANAG